MDDARPSSRSLEKTPRVGSAALTFVRAGSIGSIALLSPELPASWAPAASGLSLALLVFLGLLAVADRARRLRAGERPRAPMRRPGTTEAWLQVVSGANRERVAEAVVTVAAQFLARGHRVLVMDAGRRLDLHRAFEADARWGVGECLADRMPVLGVVQHTGARGLYLLAHGRAARTEDWSRLGHVLDEARPHFDRCVLALDPLVPWRAGDAILGRLVEGWWAGGNGLPRPAQALSERVGIAFHPLALPASLKAGLEELMTSSAQAPQGAMELPVPAPAALGDPDAEPPLRPSVLDCDLRVRERLRFLKWMRGLTNAPARRPLLADSAPARSR